MLFNSWEFLILLVVTFVLYQMPVPGLKRRTWQVGLLLVSSAVFYAWNEPRLLVLLSASCILNAIAVERILYWKIAGRTRPDPSNSSERGEAEHTLPTNQRARLWLCATVSLNLAFLAFFKYAGFLSDQLPFIPRSCREWLTGIPLPVGISFYTFQGISLLVDVWRNDISAHTNERLAMRGSRRAASVLDTSFYIAFFPQLVAGPIVKAHEFVDQIGAKRFSSIDWITVRRGLVTGYFLKIFVADNLAEQTGLLTLGADKVAAMSSVSSLSLLYGYSLQIFADFAGYSLIAIGLGALFGYKLPPNFNFPYLSTSITEFWRRWHLSLSSWLRDYLYIPLGGNRKGSGRTYFNLFLVMFLGGLWHGAAWKFALWGSLHGLFLAAERLSAGSKLWMRVNSADRAGSALPLSPFNIQYPTFKIAVAGIKWLVTFHLVTALWLTFMMPDMASILAFFKSLAALKLKISGPPVFSLAFYGGMVIVYHVWGWFREHQQTLAHKLARSPMEAMVHAVMVFLILTNPGAPQGFIYFQF